MTKLLHFLSLRACFLITLIFFTAGKISAQSFFIPTAGTSSITTCSGTLYDWNGTGTYGNGYNGYMVIYPATAGSMIRISGTSSGESCCDYVQVFQGVNGALVGQYQMGTAIPTITSNAGNGALTVRFVSDGSVTGAGPTINITCITNNPAAPTSITSSVPAICNVGSSATLTAQGAVGTVYWYTGGCGTTLVGTGNPITVTPGASTTYFARNFNGGLFSTTCASYTLNVSGTPAAPTTSNVNITCGNTATLTASGGGGVLYSWYSNANATGGVGSGSPFVTPNLTSSTTYYVTSSTTASASQIFNFTGSVQTWTVPAGVTSVSFTANGAQGGASSAGYGTGGLGGRVQGTLNVTPGQVLNIYVGGTASGVTGGWNGGGNGPTSYTTWGGGGGGATDVRIGGTSLNNRVLVAAGGGGAGYNCGGSTNHGGGGGGTTGLMGWQCSSQSGSVGYGGTPSTGGISSGSLGTAGTLGQGGNGYYIYGGGGGGGYYGGGGGSYGGGGGGSSWVNTTNVPSPSYTSNVVSGNGTLTFSWTGIGCQSSAVPAVVSVSTMAAPTATNATVGCGSTVTLTAAGGGGSGYAWYTNSNATGQVGSAASYTTPTLSTSTTYYVSAANSVSGSQTLNFTGAVQTWTVPAGVTSITFTANGASGGNSSAGYGTGGLGGQVQGALNVTPGQVLNIYVGGAASGTTGGWNGGGNGPTSYPTWGGGGGGATDVRIGGTSLNDRVLVAAGGGGAGYNCGSGNHGGGGGGTTGITGYQCSAQTTWVGLGGTPSAGGGSLGGGGTAGSFGQGGNGNTTYGGGGGGGYYGGGGASYGGGGGGSSWVNATSVPSPVHTANIVNGNGSFTFSWSGIGCQSSVVPVVVTVNPATTPTASGTSITCGQTATLSASSNATLTWYANSNGTGQLGTGTTFTTPSLTASTTYYVQAGGGSCATALVAVPVTVSSNIASPTANNLTVGCGQTAALTASGAVSPYTYLWYNNSVGGSLIGSGANFTSPALTGNTTYYVAQGTPGNGSQTFSYTGAVQTFTAPVSGSYTLDLYGAQGGTTSQFTGGLGGRAQGTITLTAGQTINIYVGEQPSVTTGGWNGGGNSGGNGRGGGGASDIRVGGTALNNRVVVAAGGGAGGLTSTGYTGSNGAIGGGSTGNSSTGSSGGTSSGGAGTQSAGGTSTGCCGVGTAGTLGIGGNGANGLSGCSSYTDGWGGGGGGGYYGGGGGGNCGGGVGGGGGSSFIGGITGGTTTAGVRTGHGQVTISWVGTGCSSSLVPVVVTVNAASTPTVTAATVNCGQTATLSASSNGSLTWYTNSNGTGQVATGANFTTPVLNGTTTYYVQAGVGGCASQITPVTATISMPAPVVASPTLGCGQSTVLAATGGTNYIWYSNAQGSTQLGTGASYTTPSLTGTTTYYVQNWTGNPTTQFYVNSLSTTGAFVTDHNAQSGDDRGGIAVTQQYYYYVGDNNTVRYDMPGLSNPISYTRRDGIFSDISGSGTLYTLWNSSLNSEPVGTCTSFTVNAVRGLNADCSLGGTTIATSQSFTMGSCSDAAVFSGHGFVVLFTGTGGNPANTYFKISLPSGTVTNLGSYTLTASTAENWARWGIAEFDGTSHRVVYVQNASTISRLNLTNGAVSTVQSFSTLSDMACITYAPWYNRWYFHHEGGSQFGGSAETAGYADGTHTFNAANLCQSSLTPVTVTVNAATTPSVNGASINCGQTAALTASSNGAITWYANSNGTGQIATGTNFTTAGLTSSITYYVQAGTGACASPIVAVPVTVNSNIPSPTVAAVAINCGNTATLSASGLVSPNNYMWYSNANGSNLIGTSTTLTTPALTGSTTYYVAQGTPGNGSQTFNYTGTVQTFIAPVSGTFTLDLYGAQGGSTSQYTGGLGGRTQGTINLTAGQTINIYVGEQPSTTAGGWNGGGISGGNGRGGGGASDIRVGGTALNNRVVVAAGGGGGGLNSSGFTGSNGAIGGGATGNSSTASSGGGGLGGGGTQSAGGASTGCCGNGTAGTLGIGGNGANGSTGCGAYTDGWGGGGGGGYYGGGGGGNCGGGVGGGGGSSFIGGITGGVTTAGVRTGHGQVMITWTGTGCSSSIVAVPVTVNALAAPVVSGTTNLCVNGSGTTTLTASGSPSGYTWYANANATGQLGTNAAYTTPNLNTTTTYYVQSTTPQGGSQTLNYTGGVQTFTAPVTGTYTLEVWGAQGGGGANCYGQGGAGGYSKGNVSLTAGQTIFVTVGQQGIKSSSTTTYNGGGAGNPNGGDPGYTGGGATHISTASGILSSFSGNQNAVLIVAGGGGGAAGGTCVCIYQGNGGAGGGTTGVSGTCSANDCGYRPAGSGGTQSAGGTSQTAAIAAGFGIGATSSTSTGDCIQGGGGGGGWYGGGAGGHAGGGGGGGSGYVSNLLSSTQVLAGNVSMPNPSGGTMTGRLGDGIAVITWIGTGCVSSVTPVTVSVGVAPATNAGPSVVDASTCGKNTVNLGANTLAAGETGTWTLLSGTNANGIFSLPTASSTQFTGTYGGSYVLQWSVSNQSNGCTANDTLVVTFNQPVDAVINGLIGTSDLLWCGLTGTDWSTSTNWYQKQATSGLYPNGYYQRMSGTVQPAINNEVFTVSMANGGMCIGSNNPTLSVNSNAEDVYVGPGITWNLSNDSINIAQNLVNNGTIIASTGITNFTGSTNATISGSGNTQLFNMRVNKSAGATLTLQQPVLVTNNLNMVQGNVFTNTTNLLTLGTTSAAPGSLTYNAGTIVGPFKRYFANIASTGTAGLFPVGTAVYNRYADFSFGSGPGVDQFLTVEYKTGAPMQGGIPLYNGLPLMASGSMIQNYSADGYWSVIPTNNNYTAPITSVSYGVTLFANNLTGMQSPQVCRIIKSAGSNNAGQHHVAWQACGTHTPINGAANPQAFLIISTATQGFSWFNIGTPNSQALPVELLSFNGDCNEGQVNLSWQTATEHNSDYFEVEKSRDGMNWQVLTTVNAAGNSTQLLNYEATDANAMEGNNYYRLTQVDIDGTTKTYDVINVSCSGAAKGYFSAYPNPSTGSFQVILNDKNLVGSGSLSVKDTKGSELLNRTIEVKPGINMFSVTDLNLAPGVYYIQIVNGERATEVLKEVIR
jgi:hypothetical protein